MNWRRFICPFILIPIIAGLLGNISLGLVIAGLTGLIWGMGAGSIFISLTTTLLVILTGNINMEIIFLYTLSLAYLIRDEQILVYLDKKIAYIIVFIISILMTPIWSIILSRITAGLLNDFNISGQLLVFTGLLLFLLRGMFLLKNKCSRKEFVEHFAVFSASVLGLNNNIFLLIFCLIYQLSIEVLKKLNFNLKSPLFFMKSSAFFIIMLIMLITALVSNLILPLSFLSSILLLFTFFIILQGIKQIPMFEMVYFSMIFGITVSRMGLLL